MDERVKSISRLLRQLDSTNTQEQKEAIIRLWEIGREEPSVLLKGTIPKLVHLLSSPSALIRYCSTWTIGRIGEREPELIRGALPRLLALLKDDDMLVRLSAVISLGRIGESCPQILQGEGVGALFKLLEDKEGFIRGQAAEVLGWIGLPEALEPLDPLKFDYEELTEGQTVASLAEKAMNLIRKRSFFSYIDKFFREIAQEVERLEPLGIDLSAVKGKLKEAEGKAYRERKDLLTTAHNELMEIKSRLTAEVDFSLSATSFPSKVWTKLSLTLENKGNTLVKNLRFSFPSVIELIGLEPVESLGPGERKSLTLSVKPKEEGDILLEVTVSFNDFEGNLRESRKDIWVKVSPEVKVEAAPGEPPAAILHLAASHSFPSELEHLYDRPEFIGKGGFARVFKAIRKTDGLPVAVKIPLYFDEATGKSFIREIKLWDQLKHRNIVELYSVNIFPLPYLEMEYCEDGNLERLKKPLPPEAAARLVIGIAGGLQCAHSMGIIHLDIKPSNVLLSGSVPKITDWGLARVTSRSISASGVGFSPLYATPEQISPGRFGGTDERTDIYQLGTLFYELVTGKHPFEGEDFNTLASAIISEQPQPVSTLCPQAGALDRIIMTCLAKAKEERYKSVRELIQDVAGFLKTTYQESLKLSAGNLSRSAFYCSQLFLLHLEMGNLSEALKYCLDLNKLARGELRFAFQDLAEEIKLRQKEGIPVGEGLISRARIFTHQLQVGLC